MPDGIDLILIVPPGCDSAARAMLPAWLNVLKRTGRDYGVTVIDDGISNGVTDLAGGRVAVVQTSSPRGTGAALRLGLAAGTRPIVVSVSCDYPYTPGDLVPLIERLEIAPEAGKQTMFVAGCRGGRRAPALWRIVGGAFRLISRVAVGMPLAAPSGWLGFRGHWRAWRGWFIFGNPFADPDSTFFAARRSALERFPIQSDGGFAPTEIAAKLTFLTQYLDEVALTPKPDAVPNADWADARKLFRDPHFGTPVPAHG